MIRTSRILQVISTFVLALVSLTCNGDKLILPDEGDPAAIAVVDGNNQTGTVGLVLPDTIIVRVTDAKSRPVVAARVVLVPAAGATGSDLIPDTALTDADGRARARWVLGTTSGSQVVTARVVGFTPVQTNITATATADVAASVFAVSGDGQTGVVGVALAESLVVRVNDQFGNPVNGESVGWSVSGGGTVSAPTVATGLNGRAAVQRVLGSTAGAQSASATVPGVSGSPVVFNHTAVAGGPTALLKIGGDNQTAPAGTFLAESLQVRLVDGSGNGVAGRLIAFTPGLGNGTASPSPVVTDASGFASSRWTLGGSAGQQSLTASGAGFSVIFTATATSDVPTQMSIVAGNNQTAVSGTAVPVDPSVRVRDAGGNDVPNVSVTFTVTGGGGTVTGPSGSGAATIVATDVNGLATLTSWTLGGIAGPNTMSATASGPGGPLTGSPLLFSATGIAGPADHLTITTQPPTTVASGATFGTAPVIQVRDAGGNPVNQANINVTVSLASGSGTLNGTKTQPTNASGQATFGGLSITGLVGPYTLDFNSGSLTGATSSTINLTAGAANKLFLSTQPSSSAQSGVAFAQQPVVQIQDAAGNPVSQSGVSVTALIATGGGTLGGINPVTTNSSGVATFTNLAITGAAGGRTLDFTATGLTKATSIVVTIGAGGATKLGFGVQPSNTTAGAAISPAVTVLVQDASGNTVSGATNAVTIALGNNPSGGSLSGTLTVNASNGVATFSDLSIDKVGTGYTLTAAATGLTGATSNGFNITPGLATQLVFTQQPSNVVAGASIAPAVTVTAQDALGNTATSYSTAISLALGNNPGGGSLTGGGAVTPVGGVATFAGLSINRTGTGYTLVANSATLTKISSTFDVAPGSANQLVFTQQPTNTNTATPISPAVKVAVEDALGNVVTTATTSITVAIGTNPPGNGILSGTKTVNAVAGVATFSTLSIDKPGTGYTLTANGGGLPQEVSSAFDIAVGTGNKLGFVTQPSNALVGAPNTPAIQVEVLDAANNRIVTATNPIRLVIDNDPNGGATTITGGGPINAVNGVATFPNVRLDRAGAGFTLTALSSGLIDTLSVAFNITAAATTTTISSDNPDPSRVGQAINVVFSVAPVAPGSGTPTGTVTVSDGTESCQASVAAGTCQLFPTTAGAKTITASYPGDGNFTASTSSGTSHQVNAANTTTLITSDPPDPSVVGQAVTVNFVVTVNAPGDGTPTGNVTVSAGSDSCTPVPVSAGSCSLVLTSAGAKTITVAYPGDGNYQPSQDTESHTVNKAATTTTIASDLPDPSGTGEAVTVSFTVVANAPGVGTPTGNVVVTVSGSSDTCTGTVAAGSCSLVITTAGAGKTITAAYAGDANFLADSDTELHDVTAGATTTTITSTVPSASVVGQAVAVHYTVSGSGGTPTGNVTVVDGQGGTCTGTVAAGQCNITFNSAGARTLVATYAGDANFSGSTSPGFGHQVNTASTATSITGDTPDPSTVGQAYTVSYTVVAVAPGGGTPTGSVIVSDGTDTCSGTVAAGSCSLTSGTVGSKNLVATYQGDGNYTGSASSSVPHVVNKANTTTTITSDTPDPSSVGQAVAVSFTVTSSGGSPTGTVTVSDGVDNCSASVAVGTCSITLNTAGSRPLTASYAGDANFNSSTSAAEPHSVGVTSTTTTITGHTPNPSVVGQPVSVSVSVTGGTTPTGTVTVSDGSTNCVATLAGGTGSCNITLGTAGAQTLTGTYSGDGSHGGSTSPGVGHTVNQASTSTAITSDTPDPSGIGQAVTVDFSVTVDAPGGGTPTGNVTVSDGVDDCTATVAAGTCSITINTSGSRPLTATYAGDANFITSASAAEPHTVSLTGTTTSITGHTPNPSVVGQPVSVSVSVTGGTTPTGTVTVSDGSTNCVATLAGGSGSCNITLGTAGAQTLTGTYSGDGSHGGSTSPGVGHTVNQASTSTAITADTPDPSVVGNAVTVDFSVTVDAPGSGTPTGNVSVTDGVDSCNGSVAAGTCTISLSTTGSRPLTATYAGAADFSGSASAAEPHTVTASLTTTSITGHNPTPSTVGDQVTVSFSVTGTGTPTGSVTVSDGTINCNGALSGGTGSCNLTFTTAGSRTLTATYGGDGTHAGSTSAGTAHQVDKANTTTAITSDIPDPSAVLGTVTVSYTVTSAGGTPTGNVTVSDGIDSCTGTVAAGSCDLTLTVLGTRTLTADYEGDANFNTSTSPGESHDVSLTGTSTSIDSHTPNPSVAGQAVAVQFTVTANNGSPPGSVTVSDGTSNCTGTLSGGSGSCNLTLASAGGKTLTATYSGGVLYGGSVSSGAAHTVTKASTTITITSDTPDPSNLSQPVSVDYTVAAVAPGSGTPTGNVTITVNDGSGNTCTGTVAAGSCQLTLTTPGTGKTLTATYVGDANFLSDTDTEVHDVNSGSSTTTITSASPNPSVTGQVVTVSYGVTGAGGAPSGSVTVSASTGPSCTGTVAGGSCTLTLLSTGSQTLTAVYAGDVNFGGSTSPPFGHQVNSAATTTSIASDTPDPSTVGQAYAVDFSVAVTAPGGGTPTGSVSVSDGSAVCSGTVAAGTCNLVSTTAGAKTLTATYAGDGNYTGSASAGAAHTVGKAATTATITSDTPDPSSVGQAVVVDFTVTSAGGTPTGNITVSDGPDSCIGTVAAGTCTITLNTPGARTLTATYAGDANFLTDTDTEPHSVGVAATTTSITGHTPNPSVVGQPVSVSVSVTGGTTPTGTVTVSDGATNCVATLAGGTGSCNIPLGTAGARTLTGTYSGDGSHGGSTSPGVGQTVNQANTSTAITSDTPDPSGIGQAVTVDFSVTVDAPGNGAPTGNVTVSDGVDDCTATVAAGTCNIIINTSGSRPLTATYAGDANFITSASAAEPHTVSLTGTTTTISGHTPNPSVVGQPVSVSVSVTGGTTPTGTVTVSDGATNCVATLAGGTGSCNLTLGTAGARTLTGTYSGDGSHGGSTSPGVGQTVNQANTSTAITSDTPDPSGIGQAVTVDFSVTVDAPGNGAPTGNVTVSDGVDDCTATVAAGTCNIIINASGSRPLTATYAGDANFITSASAAEPHTVSLTGTTTSITGHTPNPSVVGQAVAVSVSVTGGTTPTGTVTVSDGSTNCVATLAGGTGSCNLTLGTAGARTLTGTYSGDGSHGGSTSPGVGHTVNQANTSTAITSDTPDPSGIGQAVTVDFSVTVDAPGGGTPTGNVTVSDGVDDCTATVAAGTCSITINTSGSRPLTATYAGDANFITSASAAEPHTVSLTGTTTSITGHTPNPSVVGQPVSVSVSVTGGTTPTGTVTVSDGSTNCVATLAGGSGSCNITLGTAGAQTLTGTYSGDGSHSGSTSPSVGQTVNTASTTTTITSDSPDPSNIGQAVTVDFSVTVDAPGSGAPTGNVTVSDGTDTCIGTVAAGSCVITLNTVGPATLTATYDGDADFSGSASAAEPHMVGLTGTTTSITGNTPNPSVVGQPVAVSVSVTGGSTPTGTVTVSDGSTNCVATLASGTGSCNITLGTAGALTLTGTYSGDGSHSGSTSPGVGHTVNQANTSTAITSDSPDPSSVGEVVTVNYAVTVDAPGGGSPTGNVTVSDGDDSCVAPVAAGSCDVSLLTLGSRPLTATYVGDADFNASTSAAEPHTVTLHTTTTTITSHTPSPSIVGQPVDVSFTVSGGLTPTGTVTVGDGVDSCQAALSGGAGNCTLTLTTPGTRTLTADYGGDGSHGGSTSTGTSHVVDPFGPVDPGASTAVVPDGQAGQPTTITIQARDQYGNAVTIGGALVSVTISGLNTDTAVVTDNDDGTYSAEYTPANGGGVDTIDITINGTPIQGSPFSSTIP